MIICMWMTVLLLQSFVQMKILLIIIDPTQNSYKLMSWMAENDVMADDLQQSSSVDYQFFENVAFIFENQIGYNGLNNIEAF